MSILSKTKKTIVPSPDMPRGFDDPDSPYYVPDNIRPLWADAASQVQHNLHEVIEAMSWTDAVANIAAAQPKDEAARGESQTARPSLRPTALAEQKRLLSTEYATYVAIATHNATVDKATVILAARERSRATRERVEREGTCPVCGIYDRDLGGKITRRHLLPAAPVAQAEWSNRLDLTIVSCCVCHALAVEVFVEQLKEQASGRPGLSRIEAVRQAVSLEWKGLNNG